MSLAVVTGAGIRVGKAVALALADDGFDVVVHANWSLDAARETMHEIESRGRRAFIEQADLSDDAALDAFADRVSSRGAVDVLVNSAAAFEDVPFAKISREQFRRMQKINIEAPFFLTQRLLPALQRSAAPIVVNIVDVTAHRPLKQYAHYTASKGALYALTKALTVELAPKIRVCGVSPGIVAFPQDFPQETRDKILARIPLKREGSPHDVGRAVVFLVRSPYVNGVVLPVDGGWEVTL